MGRCAECSTVRIPACVACMEELEARLAGALGALERAHRHLSCNGEGGSADCCPGCEAENAVEQALTNTPPTAARLLAITRAAEERKQRCQYPPGYCDTCDDRMICKAVRSKGG